MIFPPVLLAMSTKGCALVTPVVPLGSTPNLKKYETVEKQYGPFINLFGGILLDTGEEVVFRIRVAWVLRKVQLPCLI